MDEQALAAHRLSFRDALKNDEASVRGQQQFIARMNRNHRFRFRIHIPLVTWRFDHRLGMIHATYIWIRPDGP